MPEGIPGRATISGGRVDIRLEWITKTISISSARWMGRFEKWWSNGQSGKMTNDCVKE